MQRVRAEVRRQDLVAATVAVIAEHGVKGATTRRIAEAAGCPLASLHYVFHSKDELLLAVYESLIDLIRSDSPDAPEHGSLAELAEFNLRSVMAWFEANPAYAKTQSELYTWALRHQPDVAVGALRISLEGARAFLSSAEPRPDAKALDAVARLTIALADGLLFSWFAQEDPKRLATDVDHASKMLAAYAATLSDARPAAKAARKTARKQ
ncbi:TetR family transcriptional regulator [Burkholderia cenocepacia]|uniref:TetR/AcrR family transcriptional regulator n=1 Tax=Burkholderia TaxID=32008 RepID=UPI000756B05E|nr:MULTISPECIES: TetR/AcrR family transcriptional regulator [Burkholderia]MDP9547066.1 AcrR family transcriptional regulator [Burkholderia cepacia]ELW9445272.1 TetR family transcriptional regulator [Burkholderia cenocepacia]KWF20963.1 TetR family transcriptional regulator [Burkholderia cenocepacia]MBJ9897303.1 TetR family transcriptional regulator [Burkholderia cenocepacia]MBN3503132.1 TetR family transcriptional regulator [Burkholderia cenocepacia]